MVFNEKKIYKGLVDGEKHFREPRSGISEHLGQQDAAESEFVELDDVPMKKVRSIGKIMRNSE